MWIQQHPSMHVQQRRYQHHTVVTTMISLRKQFFNGYKEISIETKINGTERGARTKIFLKKRRETKTIANMKY
jgi:hypothetical protein